MTETTPKASKKATLVVDIDGTLCPIKTSQQNYEDLVPYNEMRKKLREYYDDGFRICLFTARNMRTHGGNLGLINKHTAPILISWLEKWDIPYDEIIFGKPWPQEQGFYIDDRSIRPREFLNLTIEEIEQVIAGDRLQEEL